MDKCNDIILNNALSSRCLKWIKISLEAFILFRRVCGSKGHNVDEIPWQPWLQVAGHTQVCADHYTSLTRDRFIKQTIFLINQLPSGEQHAFLLNAQEHSGVQKWFFCIGRKWQANLTEDCWLQRYYVRTYALWKLAAEQGKDWRKDLSRRLPFHRHQRTLTGTQTWDDRSFLI